MLRICLTALLGLTLATPASAATWAESMFDSLTHDFGSVTRGPTLSHSYRLTNTTGQSVHIAGIRVSCGCTGAAAMANEIAPGQSTTIALNMDTRRFAGYKAVTIYVQFDRPYWEEVRLTVAANSRDDVHIAPESLSFGTVTQGAIPSRTATISFHGPSTQLISVQSDSNYIQLSAKGVKNTGVEFVYEVTATLRPDTPVGKWYTDVWLNTSNPESPRMRLPLSVSVEASLTFNTPVVSFGTLKPGDTAERRVILRGPQPFKIASIAGTDDVVAATAVGEGAKPVHVLVVGVKATSIGDVSRKLRIVTDLPGQMSAQLPVTASVLMPHAE